MKRVTMDSQITLKSREYKINANRSKRHGCFVEILGAIESNLSAMLSYHCKVFVVQFVVRCYQFEPKNKGISRLMAVFKKRLRKRYGDCRVTGGWVREMGESQIQHYHVALFLDGNKVRCVYGILDLVCQILDDRGYPRASFVKPHMVARNDESSIQDAFFHLSYLAKTRTKSDRLPSTNDYSFGRMRAKP